MWAQVGPKGKCVWTATTIAKSLDCARGHVSNVVLRARDAKDPRAIHRRKGFGVSYILDTGFEYDLLEDEAKTVLETVGYEVTFRTGITGRVMVATYHDIKWTFDLYKGRYDKEEIKEAIRDITQQKKRAKA